MWNTAASLKYRGLARAQLFTWRTAAGLLMKVLQEVATKH